MRSCDVLGAFKIGRIKNLIGVTPEFGENSTIRNFVE